MPTAYQIIRDAILNKHIIKARYDNKDREMCPHAIGRKSGVEHALFYQFGGASSQHLGPDGSAQNWRCLAISKLSAVTSEPGSWHTAQDHSKRNTCIDRIDVEVSY
jgi:hypothetical protein